MLKASECEVFDTAGCCEVPGDGSALSAPFVVEVVGDTGTEGARSLANVFLIAAVAVDQVYHTSRRARETVQDIGKETVLSDTEEALKPKAQTSQMWASQEKKPGCHIVHHYYRYYARSSNVRKR